MNQVLQRKVYQLGNISQVQFLADISGMDGIPREIFYKLHKGLKEKEICRDLDLDHDAYAVNEQLMSSQLLLGVFACINHCMDHQE